MTGRRELGEAGERAAEEYLRRRKFAVIERNYSCRGGEIDLIVLRRGTVIFVEVRTRTAGGLVHPFESVDPQKRRRIVTAARHYVARHRLDEHPVRFDIVAVHADGSTLSCEHLENAFDLNDLPRPRRRW